MKIVVDLWASDLPALEEALRELVDLGDMAPEITVEKRYGQGDEEWVRVAVTFAGYELPECIAAAVKALISFDGNGEAPRERAPFIRTWSFAGYFFSTGGQTYHPPEREERLEAARAFRRLVGQLSDAELARHILYEGYSIPSEEE